MTSFKKSENIKKTQKGWKSTVEKCLKYASPNTKTYDQSYFCSDECYQVEVFGPKR